MAAEELLASWNDTRTRGQIVDFVARVTTDGPQFVSPVERIATFGEYQKKTSRAIPVVELVRQ